MLAFLIVGLTMLPLIGLFSAASDQAHNTADHTLTLALASQVAEELRVAGYENRHFAEALDRDPRFGGEAPIIEGQSHFFKTVEDTARPAGRIRPGEDLPITGDLGPLAREVQRHKLLVEARPVSSPETGKLFDVSVMFEWSDVKDRSRQAELDVRLPRMALAALPPPSNRAEADRLILQAFYGGAATDTLSGLVAARGGDLEVVRALGDVAIISPALEGTEEQHQQEIAALEDDARTAANDTDRARALSVLARRLEARACLRVRVAEFLAPAVATLAGKFSMQALGNPPPPPAVYMEAARLIAYLPMDFDWDLSDAIVTYRNAVALPPGAMPARVRNGLLEHAAALAELLAVTTGPDDLALARSILEELAAFNDGRNPNLVDFAKAELDRCADAATLRASYVPATRLPAWTQFAQSVIPAVTNVLSSGQGYTGGGGNPPPPLKPGSRLRARSGS